MPLRSYTITAVTDDPDADVYVKEAAQALADALEYAPPACDYTVDARGSGHHLASHNHTRRSPA